MNMTNNPNISLLLTLRLKEGTASIDVTVASSLPLRDGLRVSVTGTDFIVQDVYALFAEGAEGDLLSCSLAESDGKVYERAEAIQALRTFAECLLQREGAILQDFDGEDHPASVDSEGLSGLSDDEFANRCVDFD